MDNDKKRKNNKKIDKFIHGIIALMISQLFIKILGMIYSIYLTNRNGFGDIGNAIYMGGYQIYVLLLAVSSIGIPNAISKLVSEKIVSPPTVILTLDFFIGGVVVVVAVAFVFVVVSFEVLLESVSFSAGLVVFAGLVVVTGSGGT